ncbi:MAG TPA: response regulator transcription factor, partial [Anaerolineales bacterium]
MTSYSILIVEDDPAVAQSLRDGLAREGFAVTWKSTGADGNEFAQKSLPHLALLDVRLPDGSGFDFCRTMRRKGLRLPIIMLTVQQDTVDKVLGLESGADDFITKPFNLRELVLRMRAVLRRTEERAASRAVEVLAADDFLRVDIPRREVLVDGERADLTVIEFDLLVHLLRERGRVQTRERLLREVWGYDYAGYDRTIDTHIARLRKKLRARGDWIETAWGVGY